jgi:hypothetical protein
VKNIVAVAILPEGRHGPRTADLLLAEAVQQRETHLPAFWANMLRVQPQGGLVLLRKTKWECNGEEFQERPKSLFGRLFCLVLRLVVLLVELLVFDGAHKAISATHLSSEGGRGRLQGTEL